MKNLYSILFISIFFFFSCNKSNKAENGSDKKIKVGVTMLSMQNEFIVNISDEMSKKAEELDVELITVDAEHQPLKQIEQVES